MENNKKQNSPFILGLDIGKASIGWAMVEGEMEETVDHEGEVKAPVFKPAGVAGLGVRIFQEMIDREKNKPKNVTRREKRGERRRRAQYKRRRVALVKLLRAHGLLPDEDYTETTANRIDTVFAERVVGKPYSETWDYSEKITISPYAMRAIGLDAPLQPHEFGRVLLHLQRRRGYFSNRGAKYLNLRHHLAVEDEPEKDSPNEEADEQAKKEARTVLQGLSALRKNMTGSRTVAEYVWRKATQGNTLPQRITRHSEKRTTSKGKEEKVGFFATRQMLQKEFNLLWDKHGKLASEDIKEVVELLLFYQTPLEESFQAKNQKLAEILGLKEFTPRRKPQRANCIFEPNRRRAAKADLICQEARTRQMINHLTLRGTPLTHEQREKLYQKANDVTQLNADGRLSWTEVAKCFGEKKPAAINFSRAGDDGEDAKNGLVGNRTAKSIHTAIQESHPDFWENLSDEDKSQLITDMLTIKDKMGLYKRLTKHWQLPMGKDKAAHRLAETDLEAGYGKHALRTWKNLLPHLREGKNYHDACVEAGYQHAYQQLKPQARKISPQDIPQIANPIVQKALYEVRKVVNKIIDAHGCPVEIRVEMARDMANSKKHRAEIEKQQRINRKKNAEAEEEMRKAFAANQLDGFQYQRIADKHSTRALHRISPKDRQKYRMWKEEQNKKCPYCGSGISPSELFGTAEIEHILPQVAYRQNYMNTVVACQACNAEKGGHSPYEAWGGTKKWDGICKRITNNKKGTRTDEFPNMPFAKKERIRDEKFSRGDAEGFVEGDLKNTQYIAVATKKMLEKSGTEVRASKGMATALLRRLWSLEGLLPEHPQSGNYKEEDGALLYDEKQAAAKNRKDHRHHAIDALVIALTDHKTLMKLTSRHQKFVDSGRYPDSPFPLPKTLRGQRTFSDDIKKQVGEVVVSHMQKAKVHGALHEESYYGAAVYYTVEKMPSKRGVKKWLDTPSDAQGKVSWVADERMREILREWVKSDIAKPIHPQTGRQITNLRIAHRCYVKRIPIADAIESKRGRILDPEVEKIITAWKEESQGDLKQRLLDSPPCMTTKHGGKGPEIKRVRVAYKFSEGSIHKIGEGKYVLLGSYHHVEIFQEPSTGKQKGRFISMLEAARRQSQGDSVINTQPDEDGWEFLMALKANDMVRLDNEEALGAPLYRVQKLSATNNRIFFRHHSIATVEDDHGMKGFSTSKISCQKVKLDELGREIRQKKPNSSDK